MTSSGSVPVIDLPDDPTTFKKDSAGGIGVSRVRPDAGLKSRGQFEFSSDLHAEGMIWGATLRSPHAHARIVRIDTAAAKAIPGVHAVLTAADVPGTNLFGLLVKDQPVLAGDTVLFQGEAVAVVAADTPLIARRAAATIVVEYEELPAIVDAASATDPTTPHLHEGGNLVRETRVRTHGDPAEGAVVVEGVYEMGMQDQAALGTESGLAVPAADGGVDLYVNTQWTHIDRNQLATVLDKAPDLIRVHTAGVGGAFGSREDITLQAHLCLLALRTNRAVKMQYSREESFFGHVHRHPAWMRYRHTANADGKLVSVQASIVLDGGAYASTSAAVGGNSALFAIGPYECPNVNVVARVVYTNNPPCGAMRGFGAVQPAFAYESQMNKLAAALGMDPLQIRLINAMRDGSRMPTGQQLTGSVPVTAMLERLRELPDPAVVGQGRKSTLVADGFDNIGRRSVRRGVGYGIGFKAAGIPEGVRDYTVARVRLYVDNDMICADVENAGVEVGQGLVTIHQQIVESELGVARVRLAPTDTSAIGSAGSSSASRATYMTAGALRDACHGVRDQIMQRAHDRFGHRLPNIFDDADDLQLIGGFLCDRDGVQLLALVDIVAGEPITETRKFDHIPTTPIDEDGQGRPHMQLIFCAHRAVVDVDIETGLVQVVDLAVVEDVGRAMNPMAVEGQMQGGSAQGLGLALMEEIVTDGGLIRNPSFTDYLIPTFSDVPDISTTILEFPDPDAPYGLKGVGEPSIISSPPAVAAAVSDAVGAWLDRVPIRPSDVALLPSVVAGQV